MIIWVLKRISTFQPEQEWVHLTMASEQEAYTLTDLATYLSMQDQLSSKVVSASPDFKKWLLCYRNQSRQSDQCGCGDRKSVWKRWMLSESTFEVDCGIR